MFTPKLTASEVLSLIVAAPPGTSLCHVLDNGTMLAALETNQPDWRSQRKPPTAEAKSEFKTIADYEAHRAKVFNRKG